MSANNSGQTPQAPQPNAAAVPPAADPAVAGNSSSLEPAEEAVLEYLRKRGMVQAATELSQKLKEDSRKDGAGDKDKAKSIKDQLDEEDAQSRNQRSLLARSTGGGYGYDRDAAAPIAQWGVPDTSAKIPSKDELSDRMGVEEARALLDSFTTFQLWVLSLPEHDGLQLKQNPILKAQKLLKNQKGVSVKSIVETLLKGSDEESQRVQNDSLFHLPPSAKPELFAVAFALLVHTYSELLEVGMESTAHVLRDTFRCVYETVYADEYNDLYQCNSTEGIIRLNSHNSQHMEALANLKQISVQVAAYQMKRDELASTVVDSSQKAAKEAKLLEYERAVVLLQQKYTELSQRASAAFDKMNDLPFLRRARAVRWHLSMSVAAYGLLTSFLNTQDSSLLAMTTLLQTKCELHVEKRDPLPFTPACVLDDNMEKNGLVTAKLNQMPVSWAAPLPRQQDEIKKARELPFPKYHLEEEYEDEKTAKRDKTVVEFNRALLINGFRRLEALERKREYDVLPKPKIAKEDYRHHASSRDIANPLEPSILLSTLGSNSPGTAFRPIPQASTNRSAFVDASSIWEESGIGLCCAKICPPDGRQVAVGCDDAAIRIWNLVSGDNEKEPAQVLLGHKNGLPVFDVSWNHDGRSLFSAGGDGSIRLWDTKAVGYFGDIAQVKPKSQASRRGSQVSSVAETLPSAVEGMNVPGLKKEDADYSSGVALAVYRGHAPSTPVWSVACAPCCYYFASAGADATARLWATDRPNPIRIFAGHTNMAVNCLDWHPNCNYIITGSEDKTARLWDVHSGRTVRVLNGCGSGISVVKISPCGKYAAGGDYDGTLHLWDMGTGKKVREMRPPKIPEKDSRDFNSSMAHALSFSACGKALASGGDDCCVRIWDMQKASDSPCNIFPTRQTLILDLQYNKRNLLLSVGKYATPVPAPATISD